jgi:CRP-like cAMP-binding protein
VADTTGQSWIDAVPAGRTVVREGAAADAFYVVLAGEFDVVEGETLKRTLGAGATFGEIGLLHTGVRTASVVARSDGELVVVPTEEFAVILRRAVRDGLDLHAAGLAYSAQVVQRTSADDDAVHGAAR